MSIEWSRWLYTAGFYAATPALMCRLLYRARRAPAYGERWLERAGVNALSLNNAIWVHAVSVGETIAARRLVDALLERYPDRPLLITTMTPTGSERVKALFGDRVHHVYLPYDMPLAIDWFFKRIQPSILLVMETELWPNWVHGCAERDIPVLLVNARLSEKSASGYGRVSALTRPMLQKLSAVLAQSDVVAERFVALGAPSEKVQVTGTLKVDAVATAQQLSDAKALRTLWGDDRPILMLASSHDDEEAQLLSILSNFYEQSPNGLVVIVPRHPERFEPVHTQIQQAGLKVERRTVQREHGSAIDGSTQVILGDTMGELSVLMGAVDAVIMGGSFVSVGGHNVLEPLVMGTPVIIGPRYFNFQEVVDALDSVSGINVVATMEEAITFGQWLLSHPQERKEHVNAAQGYIESQQGVLDKVMECVDSFLT